MRVVYLAAGAAGMLCGSCLRDNRLVATLRAHGRDVLLVPLYTPIRTDEADVSERDVFYGGINVYLKQKSAFFRYLPRFLTRALDARWLLDGVGRFASKTRPADVADLTLSILRGEDGNQEAELERLVEGLRALRPRMINLPNLMFLGIARRLRQQLKCAVVCTLSGEDLFLDALPDETRAQALEIVRHCRDDASAYIATSRYYRDHCVRHFGLPAAKVHHVPMGIETAAARPRDAEPAGPFTIGYLARIGPEKGLMNLARAFVKLRDEGRNCRLKFAGYLGEADRPYLQFVQDYLMGQGCANAYEYLGEVSREQKFEMLSTLHVFSVPTDYAEAKGLFVLEALAAGVPVVQPDHGSFPELIDATGGGLVYEKGSVEGLAGELRRLMDDGALRRALGEAGRQAVRERFSDAVMADGTWRIYERCAE